MSFPTQNRWPHLKTDGNISTTSISTTKFSKLNPMRESVTKNTGLLSIKGSISSIDSLKSLGPINLQRPQILLVNCEKHPGELLKFIDMSSEQLAVHCEVCIVENQKLLKQEHSKLERIVDMQKRFKSILGYNIQQLKDVSMKAEKYTKEMKMANNLAYPMIQKIEEMEIQTTRQIGFIFGKLKERCMHNNSRNGLQETINQKIDEYSEKIEELDSQGYLALKTLRGMIYEEHKLRQETHQLFADISRSMEDMRNPKMKMGREFGELNNQINEFMNGMAQLCNNFMHKMVKTI